MRNPIRIEGARAARPRQYLVDSTRAWSRIEHGVILLMALLTASLWMGCSEEGPRQASHPSATGSLAAEDLHTRRDVERAVPTIVFLGTSLTAGYGLEESQAFPALIQERIGAAGLDYRVINAGVSGDTSAGGLRRLDWLLRLPVSILVLELGANDMLRGQGVEPMRANLSAILDQAEAAHPNVRFVIAGMRAAPNLGRDYTQRFDAVFPDLARRYDATLIPFLLEDVAARRHLNQADGIHPTAEGHALISERVWQALEPLLR